MANWRGWRYCGFRKLHLHSKSKDTIRLCHIVTSMDSGSMEFLRITRVWSQPEAAATPGADDPVPKLCGFSHISKRQTSVWLTVRRGLTGSRATRGGGRDSTPSSGAIVAGIITPCRAVVKCHDASMGSEAGEGKVEPPLRWCSGLLLFWMRRVRAGFVAP
jgi:hypothetical protein